MIIVFVMGFVRGDRIKFYCEFLGFEVGSGRSVFRNVVDSYFKLIKDIKEYVEEFFIRFGKGGLIFVLVD